MVRKILKNIPNILSGYRLLALPFIVWSIIKGDKQLYITLLSINLITDILDGLIARTFKLETEFGARLDSTADIGTNLMAFTGMIVLEWDFVRAHTPEFMIAMGFYFAIMIISFIRFGRNPSLHLYSSKLVGYVQGIFIFTYFVFGYTPWYFYLMIVITSLAYCESVIILLFIPQLRSNLKGLFWILKEHKRIV